MELYTKGTQEPGSDNEIRINYPLTMVDLIFDRIIPEQHVERTHNPPLPEK